MTAPYYKLNNTDITGLVSRKINRKGGDRKIKQNTGFGEATSYVSDEGQEPMSIGFEVQFLDDPTSAKAFVKDAKTDPPTCLYFGDSEWFYVPDKVTINNDFDDRTWIDAFNLTAYMERPERYYYLPTTWEPNSEILPLTQGTPFENDGTVETGLYSLTLTARMSGPALLFDGTNDYIDLGAVDLSGNFLSIELWISASNAGGTNYGGFTNGAGTATSGCFSFHLGAGNVGLRWSDGSQYLKTFGTYPDEEMTHLILTYDASTNEAICYKNGVQLGSTYSPSPVLTAITSQNVYLVKYWVAGYYLSCEVAYCRAWKRILSAAEALAAYNGEAVSDTSLVVEYDFCEGQGATVYDLSGNSNDGTLTNFADTSAGYGDTHDSGWLTTIGPSSPELQLMPVGWDDGPALKFDGDDDYVTAGAVDLSGDDLSVLAWIQLAVGGTHYIFFDYGSINPSTGDNGAINIQYWYGHATPIQVYIKSAADGLVALASSTTISYGVWTFIAVTYDKSENTVTLYVNGVYDTKRSDYVALDSIAASKVVDLGLSKGFPADDYFTGTMGGTRVYKRCLSADEIEDAYLGVAVDDTSLAIEYDFCEGQGDTVYDLSGNGNDGTLTNFADTTIGYGNNHDGGWIWANVESLPLATNLMSGESFVQDRFGQITQTYNCTFTQNAGRSAFGGYFPTDGYAFAKYVDTHIIFTSALNWTLGEEITLTFVNPGAPDTLEVAVTGYDIEVTLGYSDGAIDTTYDDLVTLLNSNDDVLELGYAELAPDEDGTTLVSALAETALELNVSCDTGSLIIEDDREAEWHLSGVHPFIAGGLVFTFTPTTTGEGVASLEVSTNSGTTWETVIDSEDENWTEGLEMEVTVHQARGFKDVWVRIACDADITSVSIIALEITQNRYVSNAIWPKIPVDVRSRAVIGGSGWCDVSASWADREHP